MKFGFKRLCSLFVFALYFTVTGYCDDTHVVVGAGGVGYFSDKEDRFISLDYEKISIVLFDNYYSVNVDFDFTNHLATTLDYDIGFPVVSRDWWHKNQFLDGQIPIQDFSTSVNGEHVNFVETSATTEEGIAKWYTKKVSFPGNVVTKININYKAKYGRESGGNNIATYFYGSAYIWRDAIQQLDLYIENNSKFELAVRNDDKNVEMASVKFAGSNKSLISLYNLKPTKKSQFDLWLVRIDNQGMWESDREWYKTNYKFDPQFYYFLTPEQLRIERNFFYALNGYIFKSKDLTDFFLRMPWYKPEETNVDMLLTAEEKKAIEGISALEKMRSESQGS